MLAKLNNDGEILTDLEPFMEEFITGVRECIEGWATPQTRTRTDGLRMSNIGRPNRQLWFELNHDEEQKEKDYDPSTQIKFLYGHLIEQVVLLLVKAAGHNVTSLQKEVNVDGIKGRMDSMIDGEVVDIKTASQFSFDKFISGKIVDNDSFGYLAQLAGYEAENGTGKGGFLVVNKVTGELCLFIPEDLDKPNIHTRIAEVKEVVKEEAPPSDLCYDDIPNGKAGNMTIHRLCKYCPHKMECREDANEGKGLRLFKYSTGPEYFTKVVKAPKVEEIING